LSVSKILRLGLTSPTFSCPQTIWKAKALTSNKANSWIQKLDTDLRNKVTFNAHPTNPQVDIKPTGSCEFWIRKVDLVRYKPKPTTEQPLLNTNPPPLIRPEIYSSRVACTYSTDGSQGMMTPEHLNILHTAFHTAKFN